MHYYSLGKQSPNVDFKTAAITGQAPDKGLYFPTTIPQFTPEQIERFKTLDKASLAFEIMKPYVGGTIDDTSLQQICAETINFEFPLVPITENIAALELFHGPTLAFKDVGARFMSRCLGKCSNTAIKTQYGISSHKWRHRRRGGEWIFGRGGSECNYFISQRESESYSGVTINHLWSKHYGIRSRWNFRRLSSNCERCIHGRGIKRCL